MTSIVTFVCNEHDLKYQTFSGDPVGCPTCSNEKMQLWMQRANELKEQRDKLLEVIKITRMVETENDI